MSLQEMTGQCGYEDVFTFSKSVQASDTTSIFSARLKGLLSQSSHAASLNCPAKRSLSNNEPSTEVLGSKLRGALSKPTHAARAKPIALSLPSGFKAHASRSQANTL